MQIVSSFTWVPLLAVICSVITIVITIVNLTYNAGKVRGRFEEHERRILDLKKKVKHAH